MEISFKIKEFTIELFDDPMFSLNSFDNKIIYDKVVGETEYKPSSKHGIIVRKNEEQIGSIILLSSAGGTGIHESCYVLSEYNLIICVGDSIYNISLPDLSICWCVKVDFATAFEIFKMNEDYIVHGECSITRINKLGEIVWGHSGSDIFVLHSGESAFEIKDNFIYARSWDERKYCFSYEGDSVPPPGNSN